MTDKEKICPGDLKQAIDHILAENNRLRKENAKLREGLHSLWFHCLDYNQGAESLVLAMEIDKAEQILSEVDCD